MKLARDVMTKKLIVATPEVPISKVLGLMEKHDVKEVPVVSDRKYIGIVTFFDLIDSLARDPNAKVGKFAISVPTVEPDTPIDVIAKLMVDSGVEAIPVVEEGNVVGIVSDYDLLDKFMKYLTGFKVIDFLRKVPSVNENDPVSKARSLMRFHKVNRLPVIDPQGNLVGMILDIDITRAIFTPQKRVRLGYRLGDVTSVLNFPVKGLMRKNVPILKPNETAKSAALKLLQHNLKGTVVVEGSRPIGILLRKDLLAAVVERLFGKGAVFRISGMEMKPGMMDVLTIHVAPKLRRFKALDPEIQGLDVHIKKVHGQKDHIYEISVRTVKPGRKAYTKVTGFNIIYTLEEALEKLERQLEKQKPKRRRVYELKI